MFNKEAFVQATDQEFFWTMTPDWSDPLLAKQCFCFKFLCHSYSPQNQCDLRLLRPTDQSHETGLRARLHRVEGALFLAKHRVVIYAWKESQPEDLLVGATEMKQCGWNTQRVQRACATHLQNAIFREVCAMNCIFHFIFAIKSTQCGWTKKPCNFLLEENILVVISRLVQRGVILLALQPQH